MHGVHAVGKHPATIHPSGPSVVGVEARLTHPNDDVVVDCLPSTSQTPPLACAAPPSIATIVLVMIAAQP